MERLIIIGAGASGLMAGAIAASKNISTLILEHTDNIGKKILSTGNGKCNMTNYALDESMYYCEDSDFIRSIIKRYNYTNLIDTFADFGLLTRDREGYVYPYSEQASAVREILEKSCQDNGVKFETNCKVTEIRKVDDYFEIYTNNGVYESENVLIATGGKSFAKSGSDGSGYKLARDLGHKVTKTVPALSALICQEKYYKQVAGVRVKGTVALYSEDEIVAKDDGELQLADYGVSGIPVFNISRNAAYMLKNGKKPYIVIDFMKEYSREELIVRFSMLRDKFPERTLAEQLSFYLNKKLVTLLINLSNINLHIYLASLTDADISILVENIKEYKSQVVNIKGFDFAQVTAGGVRVCEINSNTMESGICSNLYFAGEVIDVDGRCGGYNLHFAWATAYIAAMSIADKYSN